MWHLSRRVAGHALVAGESGPTPTLTTEGAPVVSGSIPDQTVFVGESVTVSLASGFRDPDGGALSYAMESSAPRVANVAVSDASLTITAFSGGKSKPCSGAEQAVARRLPAASAVLSAAPGSANVRFATSSGDMPMGMIGRPHRSPSGGTTGDAEVTMRARCSQHALELAAGERRIDIPDVPYVLRQRARSAPRDRPPGMVPRAVQPPGHKGDGAPSRLRGQAPNQELTVE